MHYLLLFKKFYCWPFSNITPLMQENPNKCFDVISKALVLTYFHLTKGHVFSVIIVIHFNKDLNLKLFSKTVRT